MDTVLFSDQIDQFAAAHSRFVGAVRDMAKDQDGYGYKYADLAQLLGIARPLLMNEGLSVMQFSSFEAYSRDGVVSLPEVKGFTPHLVGDVCVETLLTHESGQYMRGRLTLPVETKKGLSIAQCIGMAITYGRRYQIAGALGIAQADDDAAHDASGPPAQSGQGRGQGQGRGRSSQPSRAANSNEVKLLPQAEVADLTSRINAIGRNPSKFARAVASVNRLEQIPAAQLGNAKAMLEKAEKAAADRAAQASTAAAGPDEGDQVAADAG